MPSTGWPCGAFEGNSHKMHSFWVDGPDQEQVVTKTTTYTTATPDGAFRAAIQVSEVGAERYLDKSWRVR